MVTLNPFLLAADRPAELLPLLQANPELASQQDEHGYSLVHAAASYNHLDLLRALIIDFEVDVNIRDEDNETALFVVETAEAAKVLVEELGADITAVGYEGKTARLRLEEEAEFPEAAAYLASKESGDISASAENLAAIVGNAPPLPEGVSINVGTMAPEEVGDNEVDEEFRRQIEELAARPDFQGEEGQAKLRELVIKALQGQTGEEREVRQRTT
jgi:hypothetical protein